MRPSTIGALVALVLAVAAPAQADWQGKEVRRDGALVIENPETPVAEVRVPLQELWRRGDEEDDLLFGRIGQVLCDESGEVYVLDTQLSEIIVLSPEGEYVRTVGREGEGPGEFSGAFDMYLGRDDILGVVRIFPGKIIQIGTDNAPAASFPLPTDEGGGYQLVFRARGSKDRVVVSGATQGNDGGKQIQTTYLKSYDYTGKEMAHFHDESHETRYGGMKFEERTFSNFSQRWEMAPDGRVAVVIDFDAYRIHVFKPDGTLDRIIERPGYTPLARTAEEKERTQKLYDGVTSWNPNSTFQISETHLSVGRVHFQEDGSLWAMSSRGARERGEGVFATYDVYDKQGRFQRRVVLLGEGDPVEDGEFFAGGRLYRVTDLLSSVLASFGGDTEEAQDTEPLQLVAYELDMGAVGMR